MTHFELANNSLFFANSSNVTNHSNSTHSSVQEFMNFFAKTAAERTNPGVRQKIEQEAYVGHVFVRHDGCAGIVVTDAAYPTRVAFNLINKVTDEFMAKFPRNRWNTITPATTATMFPELKAALVKYQEPQAADPMMKVQRELDETKIVLHKTMESLLQRGEKLDDLVNKSDQLSSQSKMFYKTAKKTNSCCYLM